MFNAFNTRSNATPSTSRVVIPDPASQTHGIGSTPTSPTSTSSTRDTTAGPRSRNPASVSKQSQGPRSGFVASTLGRLTGSTQAAEAVATAAQAKATDAAQRATFVRAVATVDLGAMRRNIRLAQAMVGVGPHPDYSDPTATQPKWTPGRRVALVVKASSYGLDDKHASNLSAEERIEASMMGLSEGVRDFFVASAEEAADLRAAFKARRPDVEGGAVINMLDGIAPGEDLQYLIKHRITPVLNSMDEVKMWNEAGLAAGRKLPAVFQFDTGMTRAGIRQKDAAELADMWNSGQLEGIDLKMVMSHLSDSDDATPLEGSTLYEHVAGQKTQQQLETFNKISAQFPGVDESIGASSTVFLGKDLHKDMVRLGATFHGQAPFGDEDHPLEPTLKVQAKIRQVDVAETGSQIGYGSNYTVKGEPELHGAIAWGYTEGAPRRSNGNKEGDPARPYVMVGTHKAEFIGSTSMDQSQIKLDGVPADLRKPGDMVTVLGDGISVNQFAKMHGSGVSELNVKLGSRVARKYVDDNAPSTIGEAYVDPSPHAWKD
jgi:alanine racemase